MRYQLDDHVMLKDERSGIIKYIGNVRGARGEWFGIKLDGSFVGKHDGQVKGKRYFKCAKNKGVFVKKEKISQLLPRRKLSTLRKLSVTSMSSPKSLQETEFKFQIGTRIQCDNRVGTVKWVGILARVPYLGVELDDGYEGKNDGSLRGKQYFKCRAKQGIFWKPDWVQYWVGYKSSDSKRKSVRSSKIQSKSTPVTMLVTDEDVPQSQEQSEESKKTGTVTLPTSSDKPQSAKLSLPLKKAASSPQSKLRQGNSRKSVPNIPAAEIKLKVSRQFASRKSVPNIRAAEVKSKLSIQTSKSLSGVPKRRSFRRHHRRGQQPSPARPFIHSCSPNISHVPKYKEPLPINIAHLLDPHSRFSESESSLFPMVKHRRSRSLRSIESKNFIIEQKVAEFFRTLEEKNLGEGSKESVLNMSSKNANPTMFEEIQKLEQTLEKVRQEKNDAQEAKSVAENSKKEIENRWRDLKLKLAENEELIRNDRRLMDRDRELFLQEKKQFQNDKSNFCREKAELESGRRRLEKDVQAKNEQLERLMAQNEVTQKELSDAKAQIAANRDQNIKIQQELTSVKNELQCTLNENEDLNKKLKLLVRRNSTEHNQQGEERKSDEVENPAIKELRRRKSRRKSDCSSQNMSPASQGSLKITHGTNNSANFEIPTFERDKNDDDDNFSIDALRTNLSDSTFMSEDRIRREMNPDFFSEISSMNDLCIISPGQNNSNFFGSSLALIESEALSPTYEGQSNGDYPKYERNISVREEEIDEDEDRRTWGGESLGPPRRETMTNSGEEDIELQKQGYPSDHLFLSPAESATTNILFDFSDTLDFLSSDSPVKEKSRQKTPKRGKFLSPRKKKVMQSARKKLIGHKIGGRKGDFSEYISESEGDTINFGSEIESERNLFSNITLELAEDRVSSEDSQGYVPRSSSMIVFENSNRPQNFRRIASESQVHEKGLLEERVRGKNNRICPQFHDSFTSTQTSLLTNVVHGFKTESNHLDTTKGYLRNWINRTREEVSILATNPSTFDEMWEIVKPERTKKIKQKLTEIRNLIRKYDDVEVSRVADCNPDRGRDLIKFLKKCERELKRIEKDLKNKVETVEFQLPKKLPNLLDDYWKKAQRVRAELEKIRGDHSSKKNRRYKTFEKLKSDYNEVIKNNARVKSLKESVEHLRNFGDFLGKNRSSQTRDCLYDARKLLLLHESISKIIREMTYAMKAEYLKRQRKDSRKNRKKLGSPSRYLEVVEWSDLNMNTGSQELNTNW